MMGCLWLIKGSQEYCKKPTKKSFCGRHLFAIRNGSTPPIPCKKCGCGTNSDTEFYPNCGQNKILMEHFRERKKIAL